MTPAGTTPPHPSRLLVAAAALLIGVLLLSVPAEEGGVEGLLFTDTVQVLDLKVNGQDRVRGTLGGLLVPGEEVPGTLELTRDTTLLPETLDLDFDVENLVEEADPVASPDIRHRIFATALSYGPDDLLRDDPGVPGDRNLTDEIDQHPLLGDGDGRLSLAELEAGVNDLPPPGEADAPTPFTITLRLDASAGNELQGDRVTVDLVFLLSDEAHADLN